MPSVRSIAAFCLVSSDFTLGPRAFAQPIGVAGYDVQSIGVVEGYQSSSARAIDDRGRIVGSVRQTSTDAVLWVNGTLVLIPPPPGGQTAGAFGISPTTGILVGSTSVDGRVRPAAWMIGQGSTILRMLPGSEFMYCNGIAVNDAGFIAGACDSPNRSALWPRLDPPIDLGSLGNQFGDEGATDINERGEIVGRSYNAQRVTRPYLWRNGQMIDIGGEPANANGGAWGINNQGEVVGTAFGPFHWRNGVRTMLPVFRSCYVQPRAINDAGLIVGRENMDDRCRSGFDHAVLWQHNGQEYVEYDLNDLIPRHPDILLKDAMDVNEAGQIAVYGALANGQGRGFLVTPYLFEMSDPVPGRAGTVNTITVTGLAPNQRVHLVWGTREGAQKIHSGCPGGTLLIRDPQALPAVRADVNGVATITVNVPLIARGRIVRLQAVAPIECQISHTVTWTFE